jgi:hypothetical protein
MPLLPVPFCLALDARSVNQIRENQNQKFRFRNHSVVWISRRYLVVFDSDADRKSCAVDGPFLLSSRTERRCVRLCGKLLARLR